jgi:hypothetical protein
MADEDVGRSRGRESEDSGRSRGRDSGEDGTRERDEEDFVSLRGPRPDREKPLEPEDAFDREKGRRQRASDDGSGLARLGFSLPPISLPEMHLPERIRLVVPIPDPPEKVSRPTRVRASWVLLAVTLADVLDALVVAWAGPTALVWVRAALGTLAAVVLVGGPGLLYAWELLVILGGFGLVSVAPTLTVLVLARMLFSE